MYRFFFTFIFFLTSITYSSYQQNAESAKLIKETFALEDANKEITALALSADSNYIAAGLCDGTIYLLYVPRKSCQKIEQMEGYITCLAFSPDNQYLAGGSFNGKLNVLRVTTGEPIIKSVEHASQVMALKFTDQNNFISISETELINWNYNGLTRRAEKPLQVTNLPTELQNIIEQYVTDWVQEKPIFWKKKIKMATILANCKDVFYSTISNKNYIYNIETKKINFQKKHGSLSSLAASSGFVAIGNSTGKIIVSNMSSGSEDTVTDGRTSPYTIKTLTFNADGQLLISGSDRKVSIWDVKKRKRIKLIHEPNKNFIVSTAYSPNGAFMAIGNSQAEVHIVPLLFNH